MLIPALLLLAAAATRLEIVDEVFQIPPGEWRYVDLDLKQRLATVICHFTTTGDARGVRLALLRREDMDRMREDRPYGVLASTPAGARGALRFAVGMPGEYTLFVENRTEGGRPAQVHLRVALDFASAGEPHVRYLPHGRRVAVIAISLAVFFGIVFFAASRLRRGANPATQRHGDTEKLP